MDDAVHELVEQLTKRKRYLQQIRALAQQQQGALAGNSQEELLRLLEAREQIMSEVDALDSGDGQAMKFLKSSSGLSQEAEAANDGLSPEAYAVVTEIKSIIGDIYALDGENIASARQMQDELRRQLEGINKHRRSKELYKGEGKSITGAFINKTR